MKPSALPGGYGRTFYLAFLACFLVFSSLHLLITPFPLFVEEIGGGPAEVGLSGTALAVSAIVLRPYMGRLSDTRGRKVALLIGATFFTIGPLSYVVARSIPALMVARLLHGAGIAAFTSGYHALLADVTPPSRWGEALGLGGMAPSLSMMIASPVGSTLIQHTSFEVVFLVTAATALAGLVITLLLQEPAREAVRYGTGSTSGVGALQVLRMRGVLAPSLATLTLGLSHGTVYTFLPLFADDRGLGNVGFFFTILSLLVVTSRSILGRLSDRWGRVAVVVPMFVALALGLMGLNWTYSFGMLMTMAVLQGVGLGGARVGTETMVVDTAPAELRGTAVSVLYFCFDTGIAVGGLAMGTLAGLAGLGNGFVLVGATCVLTMVFFWSVTRQPVTR